MRYISTRGQAPALDFEGAMLTGLARDGGLYLPERIPALTEAEIAALAFQPYEQVAARIIAPFLGESFSEAELTGAIDRAHESFAHPARAPLAQIGPGHFLLELFHGPTLAFKDFAMQLIGQLFALSLGRSGRRLTIIGATSGDTGSAAIEAFAGLAGVDVVILFPKGRVSEVQRRQMTTPEAANVHAVALEGDFDDCQAAVKALFADDAFRREVGLAAVNSINWARILAQTVYYFTAATALGAPGRAVSFTVPTGNFGDIFAGEVARRMGLPIDRLVIATNRNDILARALATGRYERRGVTTTISPSMDIQVASNFERALFMAQGGDADAVRRDMAALAQSGAFTMSEAAHRALSALYAAGSADEAATHAAIARIRDRTGGLICPHTAVGVAVGEGHQGASAPMVTLATAHPAKFPDAVEAATGTRPALPPHLARLHDLPERAIELPNDLDALKSLIRKERAA